MQNVPAVECSQPPDNLDEDVPNLLLFDVGLSFLVTAYFLENISIICVLHDKTQTWRRLINKCFFKPDHVGMVDTRQYANLIECVFLLFLSQIEHFDLLQSIWLLVANSFDFIDRAVGAVSQLLDDCEVLDPGILLQLLWGCRHY